MKKGRRENDDRTVERADVIITNFRESIESERQAGLIEPLEKGLISWDKIHELGELVTGKFPGAPATIKITYHSNNNGTAAADLGIAQWVYERCKELGRGVPIEIPFGLVVANSLKGASTS